MKAEINSMASDPEAAYSPVAEVHDNTALPIDFHAVADSVSLAATKTMNAASPSSVMSAMSSEQPGILTQLWKGIVDDFRGPAKQKVAA